MGNLLSGDPGWAANPKFTDCALTEFGFIIYYDTYNIINEHWSPEVAFRRAADYGDIAAMAMCAKHGYGCNQSIELADKLIDKGIQMGSHWCKVERAYQATGRSAYMYKVMNMTFPGISFDRITLAMLTDAWNRLDKRPLLKNSIAFAIYVSYAHGFFTERHLLKQYEWSLRFHILNKDCFDYIIKQFPEPHKSMLAAEHSPEATTAAIEPNSRQLSLYDAIANSLTDCVRYVI